MLGRGVDALNIGEGRRAVTPPPLPYRLCQLYSGFVSIYCDAMLLASVVLSFVTTFVLQSLISLLLLYFTTV